MRFVDLKNDFVFRYIFGKHKDVTASLINGLLCLEGDQRVVDLDFLDREQAPVVMGAKLSILDIKCRDKSGTVFVVEMQLLHVQGFLNRVVCNACKAYVGQLRAGMPYVKLAPVVALSICEFELWPDALRLQQGQALIPLVSRWRVTETATGHADLDQVQYAFVELPKLDNGRTPTNTTAARWAKILRDAPIWTAVPQEVADDPAMCKALELANEASFDQPALEAIQRASDEIEQARQLAEDALNKGRAQGRAEILGKLLALRFGKLSPEVADRIRSASAAQLDEWTERLLGAHCVDDVLD